MLPLQRQGTATNRRRASNQLRRFVAERTTPEGRCRATRQAPGAEPGLARSPAEVAVAPRTGTNLQEFGQANLGRASRVEECLKG
jgi:hypothetical protein